MSGDPTTDGSSDDATGTSSGRVVMLSGDLMFASRVRAAAQAAGLEFYFGGVLPDGDLGDVRFVILDLATRRGLAGTIAPSCAERCPDARLIAYGPHVQVDRLDEARQSGIPNVLTNGQFNAQLPQLFA